MVENDRQILPHLNLNSSFSATLSLFLGQQILDGNYSLGKSLSQKQILELASKGDQFNAINVVLTASDVTVDGFCVNRCGSHGYKSTIVKGKNYRFAYIWVGNSEKQSPRILRVALPPAHLRPAEPATGCLKQHIGVDGMLISLSGLLAGTATSPFGNGFYQGPAGAELEAATACTGEYAKGAYLGYAGDLLVDFTIGASYNANGAKGRKYLLPAIYDPSTSKCSTLV